MKVHLNGKFPRSQWLTQLFEQFFSEIFGLARKGLSVVGSIGFEKR